MKRRSYPSDLSDEEWSVLEPLIPPAKPGGHPRTTNMREVMNAIFYLDRTGAQWRALPHEFPRLPNGLGLLPPMAQRWYLEADTGHAA
jgi:putative transposase